MRIAIPLLVLAIGCGKKDDASKGAPTDKPAAVKPVEPGAPSPSADAPGCKLSITGAETRTVEGLLIDGYEVDYGLSARVVDAPETPDTPDTPDAPTPV